MVARRESTVGPYFKEDWIRDEPDPKVDDCKRCKKNSPFVLFCCVGKTKYTAQ